MRMRGTRIFITLCALIGVLAGCGGSGGAADGSVSGGTTPSALPAFRFEHADTLYPVVGTSVVNQATSPDGKTVTYQSSDIHVATVDETGKVAAIGVGMATITATEQGDGGKSITYSISVAPNAPASLINLRMTLYPTNVIPTAPNYPTVGYITSYFSDTRFVEDGSDTGIGKLYGDYSLVRGGSGQADAKTNVLTVKQQNSYDMVSTSLTFTTENSGNFARTYYDPAGTTVLLTHFGTFSLKSDPFRILPEDLTNRAFDLTFTQINSGTTEPLTVGQVIRVSFSANGAASFFNSANSTTQTATYARSDKDEFKTVIDGTNSDTSKTYQIQFTFNDFIDGKFAYLIDGTAVGSGDFHMSLKNTVAHTALKGKVIEGLSITSSFTNVTYPYSVYLPPGYDSSSTAYPVVYMTDGQWASDLYYITDQKNKNVILVLIFQGPDDQRMADYSPIGADKYVQFLKKELVPEIEAHYRTNQQRTYFGGSVGALLGAILLGDEPVGTPFFKNYVLDDGTFWWYTPQLLQKEVARFNASSLLNVNLYLSTTRQGNITSVEDFAQRYSDRGYQGLSIMMKTYDVIHEDSAIPTFNDYIDILF